MASCWAQSSGPKNETSGVILSDVVKEEGVEFSV